MCVWQYWGRPLCGGFLVGGRRRRRGSGVCGCAPVAGCAPVSECVSVAFSSWRRCFPYTECERGPGSARKSSRGWATRGRAAREPGRQEKVPEAGRRDRWRHVRDVQQLRGAPTPYMLYPTSHRLGVTGSRTARHKFSGITRSRAAHSAGRRADNRL